MKKGESALKLLRGCAYYGALSACSTKARYYPEDADYLLELEPNVTHYEVLSGEF